METGGISPSMTAAQKPPHPATERLNLFFLKIEPNRHPATEAGGVIMWETWETGMLFSRLGKHLSICPHLYLGIANTIAGR